MCRARLLRPSLAFVAAWGCTLAMAQATYKVVALPEPGPPHDPTYVTGATGLSSKGVASVTATDDRGSDTAYRCTKKECVQIPPLFVVHWPAITAVAVGDNGWVVGETTDREITVVQHAYYFDGVSTNRIRGFADDGCGGCKNESTALGVNKLGQVVGSATGADGRRRGFVWTAGTMQELGTLGGGLSEARAINSHADIVGDASTPSGDMHAFVMRSGHAMVDMGTLGGSWSLPNAINVHRQVAGCSTLAGDAVLQAFLYAGAVMSPLPGLGGDAACAYGMNDLGTVVGEASLSSGDSHGFIFDGSQTHDLNQLLRPSDQNKWTVLSASDINDKGEISAQAINSADSTVRAVLLLPLAGQAVQ